MSPLVPPAPAVMVCDDTEAKRYVIGSWLRRAGFRVVEAGSVAEARRVLATQTLDLVVLDVHLPDGSGLDVAAAIKAEPSTASTPVVHISAVATDSLDRSLGLDRGADAYLVDPIDPDELLSTVRALLRSSGPRRSAERMVGRFGRLNRSAVRVNTAVTPVRLAEATAYGAADVLESAAVALVLDEQGVGQVSRVEPGTAAKPSEVTAEAAAALLRDLADNTVVAPGAQPWAAVLGEGAGSWVLRVLADDGITVGAVAVPVAAVGGTDDAGLLRQLAQTAAVAARNLRTFAAEHRTALVLQRSLLPSTLPPLPGLGTAARYRASQRQVEIGGDFFDAFTTDDGRGFVVIGDVQGHSLEAAVMMAELRYSLRAYAHDGHQPAGVLDRLDAVLTRSRPDLTATVCLLVFDPARASVAVANAGHIPPLLVRDGRPAYVDGGGTLLGAGVPAATPQVLPVRPGDRWVLMTDGLVERRGVSLADTLAEVAAQVAGTALPAEELCDRLVARWGDGEDDTALLVLDVLDR